MSLKCNIGTKTPRSCFVLQHTLPAFNHLKTRATCTRPLRSPFPSRLHLNGAVLWRAHPWLLLDVPLARAPSLLVILIPAECAEYEGLLLTFWPNLPYVRLNAPGAWACLS